MMNGTVSFTRRIQHETQRALEKSQADANFTAPSIHRLTAERTLYAVIPEV